MDYLKEKDTINKGFYTLTDKDGNLHEVETLDSLGSSLIGKAFTFKEKSVDIEKFVSMQHKTISASIRFKLQNPSHDVFCFKVNSDYIFSDNAYIKVCDSLYEESEDEYMTLNIENLTNYDIPHFVDAVNSSESWIKVFYYDDGENITVCIRNINDSKHKSIQVITSKNFLDNAEIIGTSSYSILESGLLLNFVGGTDDRLKTAIVNIDLLHIFDNLKSEEKYINVNGEYVKILNSYVSINDTPVLVPNMEYNMDMFETNENYNDRQELAHYLFLELESPILENQDQIKIYSKFYPYSGMLSFMPVRDIFSFNDYIISEVCNDTALKTEIDTVLNIDNQINENHVEDIDTSILSPSLKQDIIESYPVVTDTSILIDNSNLSNEPTYLKFSIPHGYTENPETEKIEIKYNNNDIDQRYGSDIKQTRPYLIDQDYYLLATLDLADKEKVVLSSNLIMNADEIKSSAYCNQLLDTNNKSLNSEYNFFEELAIPELSFTNKTAKAITLFSYKDRSLDALMYNINLNFSKIFRHNNICQNLDMNDTSLYDYTHDVGFYLNKYNKQNRLYINASKHFSTTKLLSDSEDDFSWKFLSIEDWVDLFTADEDIYYDLFEKEYPEYLYNDFYKLIIKSGNNLECLLKGLKFIVKQKTIDDKQTISELSDYFLNYKLTILNIPIFNTDNSIDFNTPICIVNHDKKYVLFLQFFKILQTWNEDSESESSEDPSYNIQFNEYNFTRTLIYMVAHKSNNIFYIPKNIQKLSRTELEMLLKVDINKIKDGSEHVFSTIDNYMFSAYLNKNQNGTDEVSIKLNLSNGTVIDDPDKCLFKKIENNYFSLTISDEITDDIISAEFYFTNTPSTSSLYTQSYFHKNAYNFVSRINTKDFLMYSVGGTEEAPVLDISIEYPQDIIINDFYEPCSKTATTNNHVYTYCDIQKKELPSLINIKRYNGEYEPQAKDIIFFTNSSNSNPTKFLCKSNTFINLVVRPTEVYFPFMISEGYHRLINGTTKIDIDTRYYTEEKYPIDFRQINILHSNFDNDYFIRTTNFVSSKSKVFENQTINIDMKESSAYFSSRIVNIPDKIYIDNFSLGSLEIKASDVNDLLYKIDYKDLLYIENDNQVQLFFLFNNRLTDYIINNTDFVENLTKMLNYNLYKSRTSNLDFAKDYIKENLLSFYHIESANLYIKKEHTSSEIVNDYDMSVTDAEKEEQGYKLLESHALSDTSDQLIKKTVIDKEALTKYSFAINFTISR